MKIEYRPKLLKTRHIYRTSQREGQSFRNVCLKIAFKDRVGFGEAAPSALHAENAETVAGSIAQLEREMGKDPFQIESVMSRFERRLAGTRAAKAGIEMALYDLVGKEVGVPLYRLLGLTKYQTPVTSYTIGIDDLPTIREEVKQAHAYPALRVCVGVDRDLKILETVRDVTDKTLRVDACGAWTAREAVERIRAMERFGIELCEQPVAPADIEGLKFVRERVAVPIIADESVITAQDIPRLSGLVDGITVKLMKSGGLRECLKMIHVARSLHMKVVLASNIESSLAVTAAAHISPLVDYVDLGGNLLLSADPYSGVRIARGKLNLPNGAGLGVTERVVSLSRKAGK